MLCIMDTKKKVLIAGALTANKKLEEVCNNVIMSNEVESDAYDIVIVSCVASLLRATPIRIENYVDRVVNNYTYCKFQQHFRMPLEAFKKLLSLLECVLENGTGTRQDSNILKRGPDDILIYNTSDGLYHQSVTLTARMWPPIEAGPPSTIWGLPAIISGILIGSLVIIIIILATLFVFCWLLPRKRKFLSPSRYCSTNPASAHSTIMTHRMSVVAKPWGDTGHMIVPLSLGVAPPQYSAPPPPYPSKTQNKNFAPNPPCGPIPSSPGESNYIIPETHKSMWAVNPLYASNAVLSETDLSYKSRSLPSWGKMKQRPVSTTDDLEELYAKVNFSKKRRNRMRNDEAAIIALCRSRSQNLAGLPLEREGVVIYDERTAL